MNIFSKKTTPAQNIAFISILAGLNILFVFIVAFIPILSFLLVFVLPLFSTLVWIFCQKRYFPIYAVASLGLSAIVLAMRLTDALFYLIPSIITGLVFGLLIEKKVSSFIIIFVGTIAQSALTYALIPLLNLMFELTLVDSLITLFGLSEFAYKDFLPPAFIFAISLVQIVITYTFVREQIAKLNIPTNDEALPKWILIVIEVSFIVLSIVFAFIYGPVSLLMMAFSALFGVYITLLECYEKRKWTIIFTLINFVLSIFLFAGFYSLVREPFGILLVLIFFLIELIIVFSNLCLEKSRNKDRINTR